MENEVAEVKEKIHAIRGKQVMLGRDLAGLYGIKTKALNQAVKRNIKRFPDRLMFQLTEEEKAELVTNCDHLKPLRFSHRLPYAFTRKGVATLSAILKKPLGIESCFDAVTVVQPMPENDAIRSRIHNIRGLQVMLDRDLVSCMT